MFSRLTVLRRAFNPSLMRANKRFFSSEAAAEATSEGFEAKIDRLLPDVRYKVFAVMGIWVGIVLVIKGGMALFGGSEVEDKKEEVKEVASSNDNTGIPDAEKDTEAFLTFALKDDANLNAVLKSLEK